MKVRIDGWDADVSPAYGRPVANIMRPFGYIARVIADPSGAEFYATSKVDAHKAAAARIYELRLAEILEQELAVKSPLEGMRA